MYTATPVDEPPNDQEQRDLEMILRSLRVVRLHGGWGEVNIVLKGGDVSEVETAYTEKPTPSQPSQKI